jgi:hypothetical protein
MALLRFKRGTKSQVEAAATASTLNQAEPYLVTDSTQPLLVVGLGVNSYATFTPTIVLANAAAVPAGYKGLIVRLPA